MVLVTIKADDEGKGKEEVEVKGQTKKTAGERNANKARNRTVRRLRFRQNAGGLNKKQKNHNERYLQ